MTNKKKKNIHAHMQKTGMSYQAASNALTAPPPPPAPIAGAGGGDGDERSVTLLLSLLKAETTFPVTVGRMAAIGRSADLSIAQAQARHLAAHPSYCACTGAVEMLITRGEMDALLRAGAADDGVQILRSVLNAERVSFSERCSNCTRWIWCGQEERSADCFCGHPYRVAFDRVPRDWNSTEGLRCMDCRAEFRLADPAAGRSPWRQINKWQMRCAACVNASAPNRDLRVEQDERGLDFVRYNSDVAAADLRRFVEENNLRVDWARAFVSSTATMNGRPRQFWRLPFLEGKLNS